MDLSQIYASASVAGSAGILPELPATSQNPLLASLHNIFVRSHNKLVERYRSEQAHWTEEQLFAEARADNIAQYQMIVFEELAPLLLGDAIHQRLQNERLSIVMNDDRLRTSNEFATAAIRFYHWMTPEAVKRRSHARKTADTNMPVVSAEVYEYTRLNESFGRLAVANNLESFLEGGFFHKLDRARHDFNSLALDVQRGRDHGLRPYVDYLRHCHKMSALHDIQDLADIMDTQVFGNV